MPSSASLSPFLCLRCMRAKCLNTANQASNPTFRHVRLTSVRQYSESNVQPKPDDDKGQEADDENYRHDGLRAGSEGREEGAMTRRLRDMSDEALESGGRSGQKTISEAGFSEDLKKQLEERIASANFRAEHRNAFTEAELPSTAGRHTRDIATADAWTGTESIHDISLRMLNDAHKPLKIGGGNKAGSVVPLPRTVDTGRKSTAGQGVRLANARDRSGLYSSLKDSDIDEQERQKRFQELKERFSPHARAVVPGTVQGLAALANERIEDAIARGQFKNLPNRGKNIERDYNASSPFIDTTEYFLNKMIQRQEIVPPWIEKQQELVSTVNKFRSRLRVEWKRHAARMIASKGGALQDQIKRAEAYAKAELIANPRKKKEEIISAIDSGGHVSQISLTGELKVSSQESSDEVYEEITAEVRPLGMESQAAPSPEEPRTTQTINVSVVEPLHSTPPASHPFRDPAWEDTEHAYHKLAIEDLNSKTRSYNLQAPDLAKKPYYNLQRELKACYADVAPQLAAAIRERAVKPVRRPEGLGQSLAGNAGVMHSLVGQKVKVRDERTEKQYGFRQLWKEVFGAKEI